MSSTISSTTSSATFTSASESESSNGSNGDQSSAATTSGFGNAASNLYLYTFLATLVLLLFVSAAVVARSINLRVRARRAIEESIRNGTYVPPARVPNGENAPKPVFYNAHIKDTGSTAFMDEKHGRWESFVPVAAAFVPSKSPHPLPQPATSAPERTRTSLRTRLSHLNPFRSVQLHDILDELSSRDLHSRVSVQQPPTPTQAELASAVFQGISSNGDGDSEQQVLNKPSAMRVAVLIAMPDPSHPTSGAVQDDASSSTSSTKGKSPASESDAVKPDDEAEMPYVEFGIAEVPFTSVLPQSRPDHSQ